jgi:trk system potassium uptake protein TrkA
MKKNIAVFGLGTFGYELAVQLYKRGHHVLAVDKNTQKVNQIKDDVTESLVANTADEDVLKELDVHLFDKVVLGMSGDFENLILTVANLKKMNCKKIIAKAINQIQKEVLLKIGADEVILPEQEMAKRFAENISFPGIYDTVKVSDEIHLSNVRVPDKMIGKSIIELDLRNKYHINVLIVKRNDKTIVITSPNFILEKGDILYVAGNEKDITKVFGENI